MLVHIAVIDTGDSGSRGLLIAATRDALIQAIAENYAEDALLDGVPAEQAVQEAGRYIDIDIDVNWVLGTEEAGA